MPPHENMTFLDARTEICRSIEFCFRGQDEMSAGMNLMLPIRITMGGMPEGPEKMWLLNVIHKMGVGRGFSFLKRISRTERLATDLERNGNTPWREIVFNA
jgi:hypothetical protein